MKVYERTTDLIGGTPLLKLNNIVGDTQTQADIYGKLEYFNPAGSVKDRIARAMIDDAEKSGALKPGAVIIEPTSGNTGIGLASVAASRGYEGSDCEGRRTREGNSRKFHSEPVYQPCKSGCAQGNYRP